MPLSSLIPSCLMHAVTSARGVHLQMERTTSYVDERLLEATDHRNRRIGTVGDSWSSQRASGERRLCDSLCTAGSLWLQMAVLERFHSARRRQARQTNG